MTAFAQLVALTVKSSLVVGIGLALAQSWRGRSAALRHWILTSAVLCAALIPVLGPIVPPWPLSVGGMPPPNRWERPSPPVAESTTGLRRPNGQPRAADSASPSRDGQSALTEAGLASRLAAAIVEHSQALVAIWMSGAALNLLILAVGLGRLKRIASGASPLLDGIWPHAAARLARVFRIRRSVRLLLTDHPALLVTWGFLRPRIALPRHALQWSENRIDAVLAHELAHVERHDWGIQIVAEVLRAIYWFNPLVWVVCNRLRQESEQASDDAVLNQGITGSDYAGHLLDLARALTCSKDRIWLPAAAVARPSSLERRIRAMLNTRTSRTPASRSVRLFTLAAAAFFAIALAAAQGAFSTFSGTVFDETNGFIPGATLMLTNPQNHSKYEVVTDRTGHFEFVGLPPGDYELETKVMGFAALRGTVSLRGQNAQRELVLQVGTLQETITVSGPGTKPWPARTPDSRRAARRPDPTCTGVPPGGMGGNIRAPHKLFDVKPSYPPQLYQAGIGGTVELQARIDTEGRVSSVEVLSPAHPDLNAAAMDAVRQWEFDSTILNCTKVEVPMTVKVTFAPAGW
jgi:TonB family protein